MKSTLFRFFDDKQHSFGIEDLVGRTLEITSSSDLGVTLIFAKDIDSGEIFLMSEERKETPVVKVLGCGDINKSMEIIGCLGANPGLDVSLCSIEDESVFDIKSESSFLREALKLELVVHERPKDLYRDNNRCRCGGTIKGDKWNTCKKCRRQGIY